jgi:hypothetical protein
MKFEEIVNYQRQSYINQLQEFYEDKINGDKEVLVTLNSDNETLLFKLYRFDYLANVNGEFKAEELSPHTYTNHEESIFTYGEIQVELNPFFWHGCEFIIDKKYDDFNWLRGWTKNWIDEDNDFEPDNEGFTGAIHSVTLPITENNMTRFTVDFGTASVQAFMSLLNSIKETKVERVIINSFELLEE